MFPSTLFGKWRPGMFKEKLQWDAFRNHLGDLAQLKKYGTEDLSMWGEWLVYGTALGVGDRVAEAMREMNVDIDIARFSPDDVPLVPPDYGGFAPLEWQRWRRVPRRWRWLRRGRRLRRRRRRGPLVTSGAIFKLG